METNFDSINKKRKLMPTDDNTHDSRDKSNGNASQQATSGTQCNLSALLGEIGSFVLDRVTDPILLYDDRLGRIMFVNDSFERVAGRPKIELIGCSVDGLVQGPSEGHAWRVTMHNATLRKAAQGKNTTQGNINRAN
jgi:hypothetical protein